MLLPLFNSPGVFAQVDDDMEYLCLHSWFIAKGRKGDPSYVATDAKQFGVGLGNLLLHRLILDPPEEVLVDHKNGNPLDNRRINLRICSNAQNQWNAKTRTDSASRIKGVIFESCGNGYRRWRATVVANGIRHRKYFDTPEAAEAWVISTRIQLHGDFARHS